MRRSNVTARAWSLSMLNIFEVDVAAASLQARLTARKRACALRSLTHTRILLGEASHVIYIQEVLMKRMLAWCKG